MGLFDGKPVDPNEEATLEEAIRSVAAELGRSGIEHVAQACLARGIFPDWMLERFHFEGAKKKCKDALKERDPAGLPYFICVKEKAHYTWVQLSIATFEEVASYLAECVSGLEKDYNQIVRLRDYMLERFGRAPELPRLEWAESAVVR